MKELPRFSVLKANYPTKSQMDTKALLDAIGGQVRKSFNDSINTCAIRMSWCLNKSGHRVERVRGVPVFEGVRAPVNPRLARQLSPDLFIASAQKMKHYLENTYGPGKLIYDARKEPQRIKLGGRTAVQGIVMFDWQGAIRDFGATGHVDLFHVLDQGAAARPQFIPACVGSCFWQDEKQPMLAYLWEANP